jgi:hypothetical protein
VTPLERRERDRAQTRELQQRREASTLRRIPRSGATPEEVHDRLLLAGTLTGGTPLDVTRRALRSLAERGEVHELAGVYYPSGAPSQGPRTGAPALGEGSVAIDAAPAPGATAGSEPSAVLHAEPAGESVVTVPLSLGCALEGADAGDHGSTDGATGGAAPSSVGDESPGRVAAPEGVVVVHSGDIPRSDEPPAAPAGVTEPSCSERAPSPPTTPPEPSMDAPAPIPSNRSDGRSFRLAREGLGLSQMQVVRRIGMPPSTLSPRLSMWERGRGGMYPDVIPKLWAALGIDAAPPSPPSPKSPLGEVATASGGDLSWTAPAWLAEALDLDDGDPAGREEVEAALRGYAPRRDPDDIVRRLAEALGMGAPASVTADRVLEEAAGLTASLDTLHGEHARALTLGNQRIHLLEQQLAGMLLERDAAAFRADQAEPFMAKLGTLLDDVPAAQRLQYIEMILQHRSRCSAWLAQIDAALGSDCDRSQAEGSLGEVAQEWRLAQIAEVAARADEAAQVRRERDQALDQLSIRDNRLAAAEHGARVMQAERDEWRTRAESQKAPAPQYFVAVDYGDRPDLDLLDELRSRAAASGLRPPLRGGHAAFIAYLTGWLEAHGVITAPPPDTRRAAPEAPQDEEGPCPA